ncbi:MAG: hypothetical protein ABI808_08095 [Pseudonocardiales bacterium]
MALAAYVLANTRTGGGNVAHAAGTVQVHVKQASLAQNCGDQAITGAHFVINQITSPPSSITVTLSDGSIQTVALSKYSQSTAHYTTTFAAGLTVVDATAFVPSGWTGQFVLSNYVCGGVVTSSVPPPPLTS